MPKAYSYVRMSTDTQLKGDSLRRQIEKSASFAAKHNLELDESFQLHDIGKSAFDGTNIEKGHLGKFLEAVKAGKIERGSTLIVESLDRLSRQSILPALSLFTSVLEHGVSIATLFDDKIFKPEDINPMDLMYSLMLLARAHDESKTKSVRVAEAWKQKRRRVSEGKEILTKKCVGWLSPKVDGSSFEKIPERVAIVQRIFDEAAHCGMGADMIARRFNKEGVPAFRGSKGWHKSYVLKILNNRAVLGEFVPTEGGAFSARRNCPVVHGYYPQVIDEDQFYRAQAAMAQRRQSGKGRKGTNIANLFSGLLTCWCCDGPMHFLNKGKKGGRFFVCDTARRGLGCHKVTWAYEEFEKSFLSFVSGLDLPEFYSDDRTDNELQTARSIQFELEKKLTSASEKRKRVFELVTGNESTSFLKEQLQKADADVAILEKTLASKKQQIAELLVEHRYRLAEKAAVRSLIDRVSASSEDSIELRLRLASHIKTIVEFVIMFPAGLRYEDVERQALSEVGLSTLDNQLDLSSIKQKLAFHFREDRAFAVQFRDGRLIYVNPTYNDPTKAHVFEEMQAEH